MQPGQLDIITKQGAVFDYVLTITDANDSPVPFPGGTVVKMQVRDGPGASLLLDVGQYAAADPTAGTITIHVPSSVIIGLPPGKYRYDLFTSFAGDDTPWVEGSFIITSRIST